MHPWRRPPIPHHLAHAVLDKVMLAIRSQTRFQQHHPPPNNCRSPLTRPAHMHMPSGIVLAKVNCDDAANHPLAGKYGVRGFPTIRIFKKQFDSEDKELGTVENFEGERNYQTTVRVSHLAPPLKCHTTPLHIRPRTRMPFQALKSPRGQGGNVLTKICALATIAFSRLQVEFRACPCVDRLPAH
jgi:hypothetical protein